MSRRTLPPTDADSPSDPGDAFAAEPFSAEMLHGDLEYVDLTHEPAGPPAFPQDDFAIDFDQPGPPHADFIFEPDGEYAANDYGADAMPALAACDLAAFFGPDGPLAQKLDGYEARPSQVEMAEAIKRALLAHSHALVEAPTGTGKSIAYLIPALLSGRKVVVATANKSLQSQLFNKDIPFLRTILPRDFDAVVLKGRSNYLCLHKWEAESQAHSQIAIYERPDEQVTYLSQWLNDTETGDVDDLPFMLSSELRPRVVSYPDDCLQSDCPLRDACYVEHVRDRAAAADLVITNHHLLLNALELGLAGERLLPTADIYIVDEAHQLEQTATAVFETTVTDFVVEQLLSRGLLKEVLGEEKLDELRTQNLIAFQHVSHLSRDNAFRVEEELEGLTRLGHELEKVAIQVKAKNPHASKEGDSKPLSEADAAERRTYELTVAAINSAAAKLLRVATAKYDDDYVRYVTRIFDRRRVTLEIHASPINPSSLLSQYLFHREFDGVPVTRSVICTSATLATKHHFEHFKQRCGILEVGEEQILPAVFDYSTQALLYQPPLPSYNYRNADVFYDAVAAEIERLLDVSRGRALCLFTSWGGLEQVDRRLRDEAEPTLWPVRAQGDAPRDALIQWFKATPHSVLLATRSFWEGVDIPGEDLSLVVLDKMPFPTPGDPLHSARMRAIDDEGESSFGLYMLPLMTLALKQGFGRLIRRASDRGVVAILDERLTSKSYGRQARNDLPPARFSRNFKDVHQFYQHSSSSSADFGLNVFARDEVDGFAWRWQLLRLQDGKRDSAHEVGAFPDAPEAEIHALLAGLRNLTSRITGAGRATTDFGVEVRCSAATVARLQDADDTVVARAWRKEGARWRQLTLLAVEAA